MEAKRKLMLICPMLHQGGFERVCVTTAKLMQSHFDVVVVIFDSADIAYDVEGLNIIDICMGVRKGKLNKILNIVRRSFKVRQLKKKFMPDIAYSFGPTANMVNAFSKTGKEKVWLGLRSYGDLKERVKMRLFTMYADLIVCCSKQIEAELKKEFHFHKTAVLYNLYDIEKMKRESGETEPDLPWEDIEGKLHYFVSMGRDDDAKGFWHMLKAFSLVYKQMPDCRLIILGDGSFEEYKKLAEELKIEQVVYFAGMRRDPYTYLKIGELYLLTSQFEGFPNALVEGMAFGLIPVSVNCMTGPAEIIVADGDTKQLEADFKQRNVKVLFGDYGILVPAMDTEKNLDAQDITEEEKNMADVIISLLRDEEQTDKYRKAAQTCAHRFTYEGYREEFLQLAKTCE